MWKQISVENQKTNYEINEFGIVRNIKTQKELKPLLGSNGYYKYCLYVNKQAKYCSAHKIVALYFVPNKNNQEIVNHIDGNKLNNFYKNLEWCSYQDNANHAWKEGLNSSKNMDKAVLQYDLQNNFIQKYKSCAEATRITNIKHIHDAAKGTRLSAGGFIWKFENPKEPLKETGKKKKVAQYSLDNTFIAEYESISEAHRVTKINRKGINDCCNGKLKTSGKFIWKFI